ncbi:MAG: glycerophosphoryl diester phosphodiesterase membrane domain-containing protein [Novosphingobium sp.]
MKFDSMRAWRDGVAALSGNREVLAVVGGVFLLLPNLAFGLLIDEPQLPPGGSREVMMAALSAFFMQALPWLALVSLVQLVGQLTVIGLIGEHPRPTVGEALRGGVFALPTTILAQIAVTIIVLAALVVPSFVLGLTGSALLVALGWLYVGCLASARFCLTLPAIVIERRRNPFAAIGRSWNLTQGNTFRIGHFFLLLVVVAIVLLLLLSLLLGVLLAVTAGESTAAKLISGLFSGVLATGTVLLMMGIVVAIYRQLAGENGGEDARTFD